MIAKLPARGYVVLYEHSVHELSLYIRIGLDDAR